MYMGRRTVPGILVVFLCCFSLLSLHKGLWQLQGELWKMTIAFDSRTQPQPAAALENQARNNNITATNASAADERPYFVIHVGPYKTATTTLQRELTAMQSLLAMDNYTYVGKHMGRDDPVRTQRGNYVWQFLRNQQCHKTALEQFQHNRSTAPLCWKDFFHSIDSQYRQKGTSIIVSDEVFSFSTIPFPWAEICKSLLAEDWNVMIIVGYRRLVEWIPSNKQQQDRYTHAKPRLNKWPIKGGRAIEPLFPYVLQKLDSCPTLSLMKEFQKHNAEVRILNLHQAQSVRSTFVCNMLSNAKQSCQFSLQQDGSTTELRANKEDQAQFYDMLACDAARAGLIHVSTMTRHEVATAAQEYQEVALGKTVADFALVCPSRADLTKFLNASLQAEAEILPQLLDEDTHQSNFWQAVDRNKYCWIDTNQVLQDETWRAFFQNLTFKQ